MVKDWDFFADFIKFLKTLKKSSAKGALIVLCLGVNACASTSAYDAGYSDPLEPVNRAVFSFNDGLDKILLKPTAKAYKTAVPKPARTGVTNVLRNLRSPVNIGNQLLQGDIEGFANDTMRMLVNTTFGIGGLIDVADSAGLKYEREDFGQTMAVWGVGHGPYVVLPVFGPNSLRDHVGISIDSYVDPLRLYLFNTDQEEWHYGRVAATAIDARTELLGTLDELRSGSLDYYAAVRSAQYQNRAALVSDSANDEIMFPEIPDYEEDY